MKNWKKMIEQPFSRSVGASVIYPEQYATQRIKPSIKHHSRIIVTMSKAIHAINRRTKYEISFAFFSIKK
jgi:hypothetical protein